MYPAVDYGAIYLESASIPARSVHRIPQKYHELQYRPISSALEKENF